MKIMVVGSGGREGAIISKLAESDEVTDLVCIPGSHAIGLTQVVASGNSVKVVPGYSVADAKDIADYARMARIDLVVPGPEACLDAGLGDYCREYGVPFAGPCSRGARFETSKAFAHQFCEDNFIPHPYGRICETVSEAMAFAEENWEGVAVKADGMALGKGVLLCKDTQEATAAIERLMVRRECGRAGDRIVMQELLKGEEISLHIITDKDSALLLETVRDYKREGEGDTGENTGGIGGYSPGPMLNEKTLFTIREHLIIPWRSGCENEKILYRGILYPGLMLTGNDFNVLEFNARFGDPETQIFLRRFTGDLAQLLYASATDTLNESMLSWSSEPSVGIVLCSEGYPRTPQIGREILGLDEAGKIPGVVIYHSGTRKEGSRWFTTGGRILTVTALGSDARARAYEAIALIRCEGAWFRPDIAPYLG